MRRTLSRVWWTLIVALVLLPYAALLAPPARAITSAVPASWAGLGKSWSGLTQLTGAGSATDDDLLIYDTSATALKRIARSELASVLGSGWTTVSKGSDESRASNTTITADSDLTFSMSASTNYRIRLRVFYISPNFGADLKWSLTGPASPTVVAGTGTWWIDSGTFATTVTEWVFGPSNGVTTYPSDQQNTSGGNGAQVMTFDFIVENGSNAGPFAFSWAQNSSNATAVTVYAGSYLDYKAVP